jgi:DNA mismatch repair protein MutL
MAYSPVPQISTSYWRVPEHPNSPQENALGWHFPAYDPPLAETDLMTSPPTSSTPDLPHADNPERIPILRLIGQIGATYLVAEGPDGLYLIDQHAAHERVLFEKMTGSEKNMPAQVLLEPALVQLPAQSSHLLRENLPLLNEIGFQVEEFGNNTFRVRAIPALFVRNNPVTAVQAVVEDFEEDETPLQGMLKERLIARICKRMAVKGGTVLTSQEQLALLTDLESCQAPRTCPHGRPTMIHLSVDLLERQFGRRGARSS